MLLLDRFLRPRQGPVRFGIPSPALLDWTLIFVLTLALLHGLAAKPLWIDEVVTKLRVALPLQKLIANSLGHHHLPTYFLLLSTFSPGANAWMLRLPSDIGGAVAAAIGGAVGRTLSGRTAGLTSGLMLAGAPVMVQFGQDARPYALELAFLLLALWDLVTLACDAEATSGPWRRGASARAALLLGTAGARSLIGDAAPFLLSANLSAWLIARCLSNLAPPALSLPLDHGPSFNPARRGAALSGSEPRRGRQLCGHLRMGPTARRATRMANRCGCLSVA